MASWIASGRLIDVILALTVVEWLCFAIHHRLTGRGLAPLRAGPNLMAGFCLLVALRTALTGGTWVWVAAALTGALVAHVFDVAVRWGR